MDTLSGSLHRRVHEGRGHGGVVAGHALLLVLAPERGLDRRARRLIEQRDHGGRRDALEHRWSRRSRRELTRACLERPAEAQGAWGSAHMPSLQTSPLSHLWPHVPQWAVAFSTFTQSGG